jgi:hypothetical protein
MVQGFGFSMKIRGFTESLVELLHEVLLRELVLWNFLSVPIEALECL